MKKLYSLLMVMSLFVVLSCKKNENGSMPDGIVYLNQPQISKVSGDPAILDTDPLAFKAKIAVDLYFKDSKKPDYLDLVVVKNGDATNAKVLKAKITSYPAEFEVDGKLLTDLFGTISSGDNFDFGANNISNGVEYAAFPKAGGSAYGSGVLNQAGATPTVRFSAICGFIVDDFLGDGKFEVTSDGWGDYGVGTEVLVTKVDASTIAISPSIPEFGLTIIKVNTGDNSVTVDKQSLGDPGVGYYGRDHGDLFIESSGGGTANYVNPCNGIIRVNLGYSVAAGGWGAYVLQLKKK